MFENLTTLDYIVLSTIAFIVLTFIVVLFSMLIKMQNRMNELSRMMFVLIKKDEKYDNSHDDIKRALSVINGNIGSLSSSTDQAKQDIKEVASSTKQALNELRAVSNNPVMPTPNISKMMRETILENINIEVLLSQGMKIPNKQSTNHIIENTIRTYPDVDQEYTVKLCLAMIENFSLNVAEGKNSEL